MLCNRSQPGQGRSQTNVADWFATTKKGLVQGFICCCRDDGRPLFGKNRIDLMQNPGWKRFAGIMVRTQIHPAESRVLMRLLRMLRVATPRRSALVPGWAICQSSCKK